MSLRSAALSSPAVQNSLGSSHGSSSTVSPAVKFGLRSMRSETRARAKDDIKRVMNAVEKVKKWEKRWISINEDSTLKIYKWVPLSNNFSSLCENGESTNQESDLNDDKENANLNKKLSFNKEESDLRKMDKYENGDSEFKDNNYNENSNSNEMTIESQN
jgi:hypothetical protein